MLREFHTQELLLLLPFGIVGVECAPLDSKELKGQLNVFLRFEA